MLRSRHLCVMLMSLLLFGAVGATFAQKPPENQALEVLPDEVEASDRVGNMRVSRETGAPLALYRVNYPVRTADPETMARQYLRDRASQLKINPDLSDLVHRVTRETPGGYHVRFMQHMGGYPVYHAEIVVTINRKNHVTFVMNGYKPGARLTTSVATVTESQALQSARDYLRVQGSLSLEQTEQVVYHNKGQTRLTHRVTLVPAESVFGDWEILVDAVTGEIFKVADNAFYYHSDKKKKKEKRLNLDTGSGWVFDPDPLTRSGAVFTDEGFGDNNDNDSPQLTDLVVQVDLLDITFSDGEFHLTGTYADIIDFEGPFDGVFSQPGSGFHYTRGEDPFEAVNVYYHIDKSMRYINETLGFDLMPYQYSTGVRADPHGFNGADNSHYISSSGRLAFGEGGVDDAEDEDVVLHELGHGIHDWATVGGISQVQGLSEGCGDYWAVSYNRSTGFWTPSDPQYNWVFQWDGHNNFWSGRITNYTAHYPEGLTGQIHTDGQMWSSSLMSIWDDIGRTATDSDFLEALSMLSFNSNQEDAAQAFVQADVDLFGGVNLWSIGFWFEDRGYDVDVPEITETMTIPLDGGFNLISWNIDTPNDSVVVLLADIMDKVEVVLGFDGGALTFDPDLPQFSTLHEMDHLHGFWIRMTEPGTLEVEGAPADPQTPLDLSGGFNLVSYLPDDPDSVAHALGSVFDALSVVLAFDGGALTYDPNLPQFNTLHTLDPGFGYWIKLITDAQLIYPETQALPLARRNRTPVTASVSVTPTNEWITLYGDNIRFNGMPVQPGAEVTAVDENGVVCGVTVVEKAGQIGMMPVYRDFALTDADEGVQPGEKVTIHINGYKTSGVVRWTQFGDVINIEEHMKAGVNLSDIPRSYKLEQNYPNPFNPSTTIRYQLPADGHVTIRIFDVMGREIAHLVDRPHQAGYHETRWNGKDQNGKDVASGVYVYQVSAGDFVESKKLILMK